MEQNGTIVLQIITKKTIDPDIEPPKFRKLKSNAFKRKKIAYEKRKNILTTSKKPSNLELKTLCEIAADAKGIPLECEMKSLVIETRERKNSEKNIG